MGARLNLEAIPAHGQQIMAKLSKRSINSYDGSAIFIPDGIRGARVLDVGCGGGLLAFTLSKLVGPSGYVVGVDGSEKFEGGEFYDSDIFSDVEQCLEVKNNPIYNCYGVSEAMIWSDLQRVAGRVGFSDPYLIYAAETFQFEHEKLKQDLRGVNYACAVYHLIKLAPEQSEGGAVVTYKGTLDNCDESFKWDVDLTFKRNVPVKIDGYLASLLARSKYSNHFVIDECIDKATTQRNQNPFVYLKKLRDEGGDYPKPIYPMDEYNNKFFEGVIDKSM
ncbi:arsenite methyltransferase-like [Physella acuta]|uniref:arsenite methyltransferase-like n=1 Tax=Physella acuta TaxID=109671 RepID=UPI0027DC3675|nr:arsenite methyltransferase-like [Physella acuta]